jgi:hypothetical protein
VFHKYSISEVDFQSCSGSINKYPEFGEKDDAVGYVTDDFFDIELASKFLPVFSNICNSEEKIKASIRGVVATECQDLLKITMWAYSYFGDQYCKNNKFYLLDGGGIIKKKYLHYNQNLVNMTLVSSPIKILLFFEYLFNFTKRLVGLLIRRLHSTYTSNKKIRSPSSLSFNRKVESFEILFFPHQSIFFGNLFLKDHFYSDDKHSVFHSSNILHIELSAISLNQKQLEVYNKKEISSFTFPSLGMMDLFKVMTKILGVVSPQKNIRLFFGNNFSFFVIMCSQSVSFLVKRNVLEKFVNAKIALIGYEMLFPPMLYLALESMKIKTVASQERFLASTFYENWPFMLDYYLCSSDFACKAIGYSKVKFINSCIPCGLVRTDFLYEVEKNLKLNDIRHHPKKKNLILAFDFHSITDIDLNRLEPIINWKANFLFYTDLIRLAKSLPDAHIVIRGKNADWTKISYFESIVNEINSLSNIEVYDDYSRPYLQYEIALRSDLIIAKHTSIGDELIALNKPVLFYDFLPNMDKLMSNVYDYNLANIFVYSYLELERRTQEVLYNNHYLTNTDLQELQKNVNNGLADGNVKIRIMNFLEDLYSNFPVNN